MAEHGGYRKPNKPAQVSGPGKYSKRTDGKPGETMKQAKHYLSGGGEYGASKELNEAVAGGPMAAGPEAVQAKDIDAVIPFSEPTQRPDEPVTEGAERGPGRDSLRMYPADPAPSMSDDEVSDILHTAYEADPSIELLYTIKRWENR